MSTKEPGEYKTEDPSFVKDVFSNALLSVDESARSEYLVRRKTLQRSQTAESDINTMKQEIDHLKNDIGEIKGLLNQLINKIS
jgi:hypothetical protein